MSGCSYKCNGLCCKGFTLKFTPPEFARELARLPDNEQYKKLSSMLIFIGMHKQCPTDLESGTAHHSPLPWYTCKHLDVSSGLCGDYDNRPSLCRKYPYGMTCEYTGCSFSGGSPNRVKDV